MKKEIKRTYTNIGEFYNIINRVNNSNYKPVDNSNYKPYIVTKLCGYIIKYSTFTKNFYLLNSDDYVMRDISKETVMNLLITELRVRKIKKLQGKI